MTAEDDDDRALRFEAYRAAIAAWADHAGRAPVVVPVPVPRPAPEQGPTVAVTVVERHHAPR